MSNTFYILLAFGLTYVVLAGYALRLGRMRSAAARELNRQTGGERL
jgi:heme exporter protein D